MELNFTPSKIAEAGQLDHVLEYARETLTLGMLFLEFKDSIREGDGNRVLRCWKYFLFLFRASGHVNYCIEAFNLLMQYYYTLTPRLAEQMLWGRFINYEGKPGHNISADLHMEHLNRTCKDAINHLGANKTPNAITRTGKAVCGLTAIVHNFDKLNGTVISGRHTRRSEMEDLIRIIEELTRLEVFATQPGRHHSKFPKFLSNRMLSSVNNAKMNLWMKSNLSKSLKDSHLSHYMFGLGGGGGGGGGAILCTDCSMLIIQCVLQFHSFIISFHRTENNILYMNTIKLLNSKQNCVITVTACT